LPDPMYLARSHVANAVLRRDSDGERVARQELAGAHLERAIRTALAAVPPVTAERKQELAMLLLTGGA